MRRVLAGASFLLAVAAAHADVTKPAVTEKPVSDKNYTAAQRTHVKGVVIYKADTADLPAVFKDPGSAVSANYEVLEDGRILRFVPEHDIAWYAGNWPVNETTISVVHAGFTPKADTTESQYHESAKLVASICARYEIPIDRQHIIGQSEVPDPDHPGRFGGVSNRTDPGPHWDWKHYMKLVRSYAGATPPPPTKASSELLPGTIHRYTQFQDGLTGACGENSLSMCFDWATQTYHGNKTAWTVHFALQRKILKDPNGSSMPYQQRATAEALGLRVEAYHNWDTRWSDWKQWLKEQIAAGHIVLFDVDRGQALKDAVTGKGEDAHNLKGHAIVVCGYHAGGFSAHAQRVLPKGFWCADGDNWIRGDKLVFYTAETMAAAMPVAGLGIAPSPKAHRP
jgi:N-acetyl-anhydromuramyl-L-alanine amidase AmpD